MKKLYSFALPASALALVVFLGWYYLSRPNPESLADRALTGRALKDRVNAAAKLSMIKKPDPTPQLRRLAKESKDPEVLAQAFKALASLMDTDSLPQFFAALDHADAKVRQAAYASVLKFNGGALPEELRYSADGPSEERAHVARRLQEIHDKGGTDSAAGVKVALAPPVREPSTSEPPTPAKEPPASEPPAKDPSPKEPSHPTASPTQAPSSAAVPPIYTAAPADDRSVTLLIWMCHAIAILVLISEIAGAIGLILGEGAQQPRAAGKDGATASAPVEKNSAGMWSKIALLVAGAAFIVVLLTVAEMVRMTVRMEQKMDRMEQKMDYMARPR